MSTISIVTGFFDLNRSEWNDFNRSNKKYYDYFEFWARLDNPMIIYTDKESEKYIINIRKKFGRAAKTNIIVIDDFRKIDVELYDSISHTAKYDAPKQFRILPNNPECWNVDYNYIMLLKAWFVKDAIEKGLVKGQVAWIDFGFNHGGKLYTNPEEFDFEWRYNFANKINIFTIKELDNTPIYNIVRNMDSYITAGMIIGPDNLWAEFWYLFKECMMSLNLCGLMDDDQTIILMAIRKNPDLFYLHSSNWFSQFKEFGGEHLSVKDVEKKKSNIGLRKKISYIKHSLIYGCKAFDFCYNAFKKTN